MCIHDYVHPRSCLVKVSNWIRLGGAPGLFRSHLQPWSGCHFKVCAEEPPRLLPNVWKTQRTRDVEHHGNTWEDLTLSIEQYAIVCFYLVGRGGECDYWPVILGSSALCYAHPHSDGLVYCVLWHTKLLRNPQIFVDVQPLVTTWRVPTVVNIPTTSDSLHFCWQDGAGGCCSHLTVVYGFCCSIWFNVVQGSTNFPTFKLWHLLCAETPGAKGSGWTISARHGQGHGMLKDFSITCLAR